MKITSFFIKNFKEVSLPTTSGIQEDGGVYGDETNYSSWILGGSDNTVDFDGVVKTNILFGELYKITLDTGNAFNPTVPGGVPNINGFMNMDLNDYWANIVDDVFKFNGFTYSEISKIKFGNRYKPSVDFITLMEYADLSKQKVGWVEVNRSRPSLYYELCYNGKRPRVDYFYDVDKFIITAELFDVENPSQIMMSTYENVNPYTGENERYYTTNMFAAGTGIQQSSIQRLGLTPIGNWFTWVNTPQGHFRNYNNIPENVGGYFDMFPWPRGPMWGQYSGMPKQYLTSVFGGTQSILEADINNGPREILLETPQEFSNIFTSVPLLIGNNTTDLNAKMEDRLVYKNEFGNFVPIHPVYSTDIWGQKRTPENATVMNGSVRTVDFSSTFGECKVVSGFENVGGVGEDGGGTVSIGDPYGFDLYELDKEYKELYKNYKFCPPKKTVKYSLDDTIISDIKNTNPNITVGIQYGNNEEYHIGDTIKVIKIGPFNPDQQFSFDPEHESPIIPPYISRKGVNDSGGYIISQSKLDPSLIIVRENEIGLDVNKDGLFENRVYLQGTPVPIEDIALQPNTSNEKHQIHNEAMLSWNHDMEISKGIRSNKDFLITNPDIPYGTFSNRLSKNIRNDGSVETTVKILQNGADADLQEFKDSLDSITSIAGNNKEILDPIGVAQNGFPIYPSNVLEDSINTIKEQLTGVKEIIFRGSDVLYGAVSYPIWRGLPGNEDINSIQVRQKFEYINTGINISNQIDLDTGEKLEVSNFYRHSIFRFLKDKNIPKYYNTIQSFMNEKEKELEPGGIDFIGTYTEWDPFFTIRINPNTGKTYAETTLENINYLIVSKYDGFGNKNEIWAPTIENPNGNSILETNKGILTIHTMVVLGNDESLGRYPEPATPWLTHVFRITGDPLEYDEFYKIPVKIEKEFSDKNLLPANGSKRYGAYTNDSFQDYLERKMIIRVTYGSNPKQPPPRQTRQTSTENTYGGWVFNGLWHRDGTWPIDHKIRSGLLGTAVWEPYYGGINTGAWIKVPPKRVRMEYHNFAMDARETVYSYIHGIWLNTKNNNFIQQEIARNSNFFTDLNLNNSKISIEDIRSISPYTADNPQWLTKYYPDDNDSKNWEWWEEMLSEKRKNMIEELKSINQQVLILRLRDNKPDPSRGLRQMYFGNDEEYDATTTKFGAPGHLLETYVYVDSFEPSKLNSRENYRLAYYAEPTEHTNGEFKKDEWYRAVFTRAVTSPSNPSGELARYDTNYQDGMNLEDIETVGKYKTTEKNKKTFCELLYITEQILKMHRSRLVEMKKYADAKIKNEESYASESESARASFNRRMAYVGLIRKMSDYIK